MEKAHTTSTLLKELQAPKECKGLETVFPEKSTPITIQYQTVSPEHIHTSKVIQTVFRNIYTFMHIYVTKINEKGGHKLKRKHGGIYGKLWREEREGDNDVILFKKSQKINHFLKCMQSFEKLLSPEQSTMAHFLLLQTSNVEETSSSHY